MGEHVSEGRPGEHAYERSARSWLRVYPLRWRRVREDEVVGVLLDTRAPGTHALGVRDRVDLLRGSLAYRWRSHPPLLQWLLWRWSDVLPGPAHREWVLDGVNGRFWSLRQTWLGFPGVFAVGFFLSLSDLGREPSFLAALPLVICTVLSVVLPMRWRRRTVLRDLAAAEDDTRLAASFDGSAPWRARRRWAWDGRVLWPMVGLAAGTVPALAVAASWWQLREGLGAAWFDDWTSLGGAGLLAAFVPLLVLAVSGLLFLVVVVQLAPRRVARRPAQPWRDEPTPVPAPLAVALSLVAGLVPLGAAALPLVALLVPQGEPALPGTPWADALATAAGISMVGVWLFVPAVVIALALLVTHVRVAGAANAHHGPPVAVVDVLSTRGGEQVRVDTPVLLYRQTWVDYPAAPDRPGPPSATHH